MARFFKFVLVLAVCLSGWAILPFVSLPASALGWQRYAEAYGTIFHDDMESGDLSAWDVVVGAFRSAEPASDGELVIRFAMNELPNRIYKAKSMVLLDGVTRDGLPLFTLQASYRPGGYQLRLSTLDDRYRWTDTSWRWLSRHEVETLSLEWRRSGAGLSDGSLYLSANGRLVLWLADLDNDSLPLLEVRQYLFEHHEPIRDLSGVFPVLERLVVVE